MKDADNGGAALRTLLQDDDSYRPYRPGEGAKATSRWGVDAADGGRWGGDHMGGIGQVGLEARTHSPRWSAVAPLSFEAAATHWRVRSGGLTRRCACPCRAVPCSNAATMADGTLFDEYPYADGDDLDDLALTMMDEAQVGRQVEDLHGVP